MSNSLKALVGSGYGSFWRSKDRYRVVKGSRGSKKSKTTALWYILNMMKYPGANTLVIRRYERTLRDSCFADLKWAINKLGFSHLWRATVSPLEITYLPTGQKILFRGLDDGQKITSITVEKGVLCWVWCEEAYQIDSEDDFNKLDMSIRGAVPDGLFKQVTLTFNPWNESTWLKKRFFDVDRPDTFRLTTTYQCNEWLDANDLALFEDMRLRNPRRYRVEGLGEWGISTGLIYERVEQRPLDKQVLLADRKLRPFHGVDFGFTDPTAYVGGFIDQENHKIYITQELYRRGITNQQLIECLKDVGLKREEIYCDSAEPKSIEELRTGGINARPALKGADSVLYGIQKLQNFDIIVDVHCPETWREICSYSWQEDRQGKQTDKPNHDFSHCMDALRYGATPYIEAKGFSWKNVF